MFYLQTICKHCKQEINYRSISYKSFKKFEDNPALVMGGHVLSNTVIIYIDKCVDCAHPEIYGDTKR